MGTKLLKNLEALDVLMKLKRIHISQGTYGNTMSDQVFFNQHPDGSGKSIELEQGEIRILDNAVDAILKNRKIRIESMIDSDSLFSIAFVFSLRSSSGFMWHLSSSILASIKAERVQITVVSVECLPGIKLLRSVKSSFSKPITIIFSSVGFNAVL